MSKPIYLKLAWETLKKNYRISVPFVLGGSLMEAMVYSITSMVNNPGLADIKGFNTVSSLLSVGDGILIVFSFLFYLYLNSVLSKNRKQEQGLYTVLGMGKPHLMRILFYQYLILMLAIMVCGLAGGILFDKAMFLLYSALMNMAPPLGFQLSLPGTLISLAMTLAIMILLLIFSSVNMLRTNPLDLLKGEKVGEKQIKNRWILAVLGVICLGIGYWLALTVTNPVEAVVYFFIAVLFVVAGTYLVFLFGFTCLIRLMEKNKRFYYKPKHFISVSTMKYRIKASAASLASITVLSTAVLVAVSASASLISGSSALVGSLYPREALLDFYDCELSGSLLLEDAVKKAVVDSGMAAAAPEVYRFSNLLVYETADSYIAADQPNGNGEVPVIMVVIPEKDFVAVTGQQVQLEDGEIYAWMPQADSDGIVINHRLWKVRQMKEELTSFGGMDSKNNAMAYKYVFVVMNEQSFEKYTPGACEMHAYFDLSQNARDLLEEDSSSSDSVVSEATTGYDRVAAGVYDQLSNVLEEKDGISEVQREELYGYCSVQFRDDYAAELNALYSGVLFIGIYVSIMFVIAVILIMYYKQISEGTDDRKRFAILQNVGLEQKQIRQIINDQVLLIFFAPLGMAALHLCFAFPMLQRILRAMGQVDTRLFVLVTLITFAVFALLYIIAYRLTARTYYRMVRSAGPK